MGVETRVVDNRVFLLGLDGLYRASMKRHERGELLGYARRVAEALHVLPANVPVEGYYSENELLTEYFRLIRALQDVDEGTTSSVEGLPEFRRLLEVTSSALYGRPIHAGKLLPRGRDPLSQALYDVRPWTAPDLMEAAHRVAVERDDISLVGLAAFVQDPVVLTALRESVVLYAEMLTMGMAVEPPRYRYEWTVGEELARRAARFVDTFNGLFGTRPGLPPPDAAHAEEYWNTNSDTGIEWRCVCLGLDVQPPGYYHWAICTDRGKEVVVQEFWAPEVWTTERYRGLRHRFGAGCPPLKAFNPQA